MRWVAALALVLAIAGAYRFPGVSWGFAVDTEGYVPLHRDEPVACLGAMLGGVPEIKSNMPTERGMMFQCLVLGLAFKPHDLLSATRIGRTYSVLWGLASIVLTALIARIAGRPLPGNVDPKIGYHDIVDAWNYYLAHYNQGRGVVLI